MRTPLWAYAANVWLHASAVPTPTFAVPANRACFWWSRLESALYLLRVLLGRLLMIAMGRLYVRIAAHCAKAASDLQISVLVVQATAPPICRIRPASYPLAASMALFLTH